MNPPFTFLLPRVVNHPPISLPVITVPQGVILGSVLCGSVPLSGKAWEAGSRAGVLVMGNPRWWPWEAKESRAEHCCCSYTLALLFWNQQRGMLVVVSFRPSCFSWQLNFSIGEQRTVSSYFHLLTQSLPQMSLIKCSQFQKTNRLT